MFIDRLKVECIAGKGGNGVVAWRREKYIPKGGPSGGNGGKGGSVILQADHNVFSLDWFTYKRIIRAESGGAGGSNCKQGKNGEDLILKIPCGTLLKDGQTGEVLHDFTKDGEQFLLCKGGKGGKGNFVFRSPTNQAPNIATMGVEGEGRAIELELKLIADIGFVGFPNAGKSSLLKRLADVGVKIAPYPFTTLQPNLGYLYYNDGVRVLLADIPGIIEGAHSNRGLGFEFLRHIERTKALIYVLDAAAIDGRNPLDDFKVLRDELKKYDPELLKRPSLILLNKCDMEDSELYIQEFKKKKPKGVQVRVISAERGDGCDDLKDEMRALLG
jgi:GTPase